MKTSWLAALVVISSVSLTGCSTTANFSHTPTAPSEFTKNISELKQNYSDIAEYERRFAFPQPSAKEEELENLWGKPAVKKYWGSYALNAGALIAMVPLGYATYPIIGIFYFLQPMPREEYVWEKGNYRVVAYGNRNAFNGYEKRIHHWEWQERTSNEDIALNAQQGL